MEDLKTIDPTQIATQVEKAAKNGSDPTLVTMSTGVKFRVRPVSKFALGGITERYSKIKPKVPVTYVESKGREEPNVDDEDYQSDMQMWNLSLAMAINNFLLLRGTELEHVPDSVMSHESDDWKYECEIIGSDPDNPRACYIEWIKTIAAPLDDDSQELMAAIGRLSGIAQEDVNEAVQQFRR